MGELDFKIAEIKWVSQMISGYFWEGLFWCAQTCNIEARATQRAQGTASYMQRLGQQVRTFSTSASKSATI